MLSYWHRNRNFLLILSFWGFLWAERLQLPNFRMQCRLRLNILAIGMIESAKIKFVFEYKNQNQFSIVFVIQAMIASNSCDRVDVMQVNRAVCGCCCHCQGNLHLRLVRFHYHSIAPNVRSSP